MFPIRDHNPSRRTPFVTYILLAANILIFVAYYPAASGNEYALAAVWQDWATIPRNVSSGSDLHTIFTSMFLHGGWMHLAGNMLFLWIFGDNMEDAFGHLKFLGFYLLCGVAADLLQVFADPYALVPVVGASGAIAGVLGGYLLLYPRARVDVVIIFIIFFKTFALRAWIVLSAWLALQLFGGFATPTDGGGVAYWAHVGGFIAGIALSLPYWISRGGPRFWSATEGHPPHPPTPTPLVRSRVPVVRRKRR
ncbi:rhomboid family intramembrane serine protease [Neptunicoccus cionae]|uniref:rhomboid family intramembrane serine protease n=1 Tax=Neptunicoccus cionae TaxID=2035344 RepID=UPI000C774816|nr:rhomboid family intramembrane serine protease [Amylibacter cionae]PLS23488.1 rhomboid family intramembrane serine protease [Amylibacter cionae]